MEQRWALMGLWCRLVRGVMGKDRKEYGYDKKGKERSFGLNAT
jgi:hypothetical protein